MILAIDTYYYNTRAKTVCIDFIDWQAASPSNIVEEFTESYDQYESGSFYKRELPCILSILKKYNLTKIKAIIVDGYVTLNSEGKKGLGGYLYEAIDQSVPIIGVAKSKFREENIHSIEILRGESKKPLYISAIGVDLTTASDFITNMHGQFRIPTLFQILDGKTKEDKVGPN